MLHLSLPFIPTNIPAPNYKTLRLQWTLDIISETPSYRSPYTQVSEVSSQRPIITTFLDFFFGMPLPPTPKFNSSAYCSQMNASYTLSSSCYSSPIPQYLQYLLNSLLSLSYMHTKFISPSKSSFTVLPLIQWLFFFIYLKLTYPSSPFSQSFP